LSHRYCYLPLSWKSWNWFECAVGGWSFVQRSPTKCDVSECYHESSILRRPWPTRAVAPWQEKKIIVELLLIGDVLFRMTIRISK
jgi:hypothetical protein